MTESAEPTKRCPDCAETVLEAARLCRYCGYRFAPPPAPAPARTWRRAAGAEMTLDDLLEDWGVRLAADERADRPVFASLGKLDGYLLVTDRRVAFFGVPPGQHRGVVEHLLHPPQQQKLAELALADLVSVEVSGWPRSWLILRGASETLELGGLTRAEARQLAERLTAAQRTNGRPSG